MVRIEEFVNHKAEVFGLDSRGKEIRVGYLSDDENFTFRWKKSEVSGVNRWLSSGEFQDELDKVRAKLVAQDVKKAEAHSEFYFEVHAELMAEGKASHVAANLINSEVKLLAEAKRLGVI